MANFSNCLRSYQSIGIATSSAANLATDGSGPGHSLIAKMKLERKRGLVVLFGACRARVQAYSGWRQAASAAEACL